MAPIYRVSMHFHGAMLTCYIHNNAIIRIVVKYNNQDEMVAAQQGKYTYTWRTHDGWVKEMKIDDVDFNDINGYLLFTLNNITPQGAYAMGGSSCDYAVEKDEFTALQGDEETIARGWIAQV